MPRECQGGSGRVVQRRRLDGALSSTTRIRSFFGARPGAAGIAVRAGGSGCRGSRPSTRPDNTWPSDYNNRDRTTNREGNVNGGNAQFRLRQNSEATWNPLC